MTMNKQQAGTLPIPSLTPQEAQTVWFTTSSIEEVVSQSGAALLVTELVFFTKFMATSASMAHSNLQRDAIPSELKLVGKQDTDLNHT
ncbi:hypothetical protein Z043_105492 [Scleropages formosus]|uniref:Uncharacterized protein n=1 Tax=Scleropages formosus TaxID=113540 RepID=A0A0P7VPC9_SCLFO|nr:hypothetical protein Z043_105492 [Scleropages formosus]